MGGGKCGEKGDRPGSNRGFFPTSLVRSGDLAHGAAERERSVD